MHYYQHNIGDYRRDTSHLSLVEHGIYRQLMDSYYLDEQPLCADLAKLMRSHSVRSADEQQSLKNVLADFFELTENGYIHKRCDEVIAEYHGKSDKARASAMARWGSKHKDVDANALPTQSKRNANGMLTNNHKPITNIHTPEGVVESVWNDYLKIRKAAKKPITDTALKGLVREADKAGKTLNEALVICCERSWLGFKAEWLKSDVKQVEKVSFI
jgi:uncharacterized protein YdaU (DUF1376 family)